MFYKIFKSSIILCFFTLITATCLSTGIAGAEDSQGDLKLNNAASHLLDGKKFIGIFTSSECFQYGFKGGPYTTTIEGDKIHFQAETISSTHGKMVWQGTLKGDTLEVTYNWTKERWLWTTYREYWFKGTLKE